MTEIKFRAYRDGFMYYKHSVIVQIDGTVVFLDTDGKWTADSKQSPTTTLMQFSGRRDKKGKEIYEGDIEAKYNGVIEYNTETCCWIVRRPNRTFVRLEVMKDYIKVVGNIFETPHLLNSTPNPEVSDTSKAS